MKIYKWFFLVLTLAQMVFTLIWFLFMKRFDRVILLSSLIYGGVMIIGYAAFEVERYRRRRKQLMDDLP